MEQDQVETSRVYGERLVLARNRRKTLVPTGTRKLKNSNLKFQGPDILSFFETHRKDPSRAAVTSLRAVERWFPDKSASQNTNLATKRRDSERQGRRTDHACSNLHRPSHPFEPQTLLSRPGGRRLDPNETLQRRTTRIRVE